MGGAAAATCVPILIDPVCACQAPRDGWLVNCSLVAERILAIAAYIYAHLCA